MSLILEALKKLEREKQLPDRGLLVVASAPWPVPRRSPLVAVAVVMGLVGVAAAAMAAGWALANRGSPAPTLAPVAASVPAAPPTTWAPSAVAERSAPAASGRSWRVTRPAPDPDALPPSSSSTVAPAAPRAAAPAPVGLRLSAISQQDGVPVAIVNDSLVREGDVLGQMTIIRIGPDSVEVEIGGVRRVVTF